MAQLFQKTLGNFSKVKQEWSYYPVIPLLCIYPKEIKTYIYSKTLVYDVHSNINYNCQKVWANEISMSRQLDKSIWYIHTVKCYSTIIKIKYIMDEPLIYFQVNESSHKEQYTLWLHVCEMLRTDRMCSGRCLTIGFLIWVIKIFLHILKLCWWFHNFVNILNTTYMFTFKNSITCFVNYVIIKLLKLT